jgi:hypothetical protein
VDDLIGPVRPGRGGIIIRDRAAKDLRIDEQRVADGEQADEDETGSGHDPQSPTIPMTPLRIAKRPARRSGAPRKAGVVMSLASAARIAR